MRNRKTLQILLLLVLAVFLAGCATVGITAKPWSQMTPKEKSVQFIQTYNTQYENTMFMASNPNITDAQRVIVRQKKAILAKAWPLLKLYDAVAAGGGVPSASDEASILNLIDQLATMGG
jgi:uncharacterized lipoprotein YajG